VEEQLGREALVNKEKKPSVKSGAPRIREVNGRILTLKCRVSSAHGGSATASATVAAEEAHHAVAAVAVAVAAPVAAAEV
jgi:hypothetical protein